MEGLTQLSWLEGGLFLAFWFGGAILHTVYDLKFKHLLRPEESAEQTRW